MPNGTSPDHAPGKDGRRYFETLEEASANPVVYFIESAGLVKIGMSTHLPSRFADLQRTIPCSIRLIAAIERRARSDIRVLEKQLHFYFRDYRRHGEWFDLPDGWLDDLRERRIMLPSPMLALGCKPVSLPMHVVVAWGPWFAK